MGEHSGDGGTQRRWGIVGDGICHAGCDGDGDSIDDKVKWSGVPIVSTASSQAVE